MTSIQQLEEPEVSAPQGFKMAGTSWCAFSYRRNCEVSADEEGEPTVVLGREILELIGVKPGDRLTFTVTSEGDLFARGVKPEDTTAAPLAAPGVNTFKQGLGNWGA